MYNSMILPLALFLLLLMNSCQPPVEKEEHGENEEHSHGEHHHGQSESGPETLHYEQEVHLKNVRQLTFGGDNAEAYWSFDQSMLVFQRMKDDEGLPCDQIFYGKVPAEGENFEYTMVSNGEGRTTCSYFMPGDDKIIYASTFKGGTDCPENAFMDSVQAYVWPLYPSYELFVSNPDGSDLVQLTENDYYDAEATVSPTGDKVVFTSTMNGDIDLYTMNIDGSDIKQITFELGYDGGAFFSPDGTKLIFRSSRPQTEEEIAEYKDLLSKDLVAPTDMELYVCNADGSDLRKITDLGNANWAPFFHPSGEKVIFCSNHASTRGFPFNLYMINVDGSGLEQITFDDTFDSFPMFSPDGKYLVFASNRNNGDTRDTNLFIAEWVD